MASVVYITYARETEMISRPATFQGLIHAFRGRFPDLAAVHNLVVLFQPAHANGGLLNNWVHVNPSAYAAVHDGAELFANVLHPLTKKYILPLPGQSGPNRQSLKQIPRTDGLGTRVPNGPGDHDQVSKTRPAVVSHESFGSSLSLELERPGGDAFGSGWGGASERFRRSARLVPNLEDCKEAVGQTVGESNFYPDDEEETIADIKLGSFQDQRPQPTEAGWYAGVESAQRDDNPGETEAQHLAGGLDEEQDQDQGKKNFLFHSDDAIHNWLAASHSPRTVQGTLPRDSRGHSIPITTTPQWGDRGRAGDGWGGYRTPSPKGWFPDHGEGNDIPEYVRSRSCTPTDARAGTWGANPGGWNSQHCETHGADQDYPDIVAGGNLTNGVQANGVYTNGDLANGYPAAHSEVSHSSQHQQQHHGAGGWSPPRSQPEGTHRPQYTRIQGYQPRGKPNSKAFGGPRPRRDPAEVTYGSPIPRIQGSATGWTTIGRKNKNKTWANNPVQEESEPERAPGPYADYINHAWYAQLSPPPPPPNFNRTTTHGGGSKQRSFEDDVSNNKKQRQRPGRERSWGSDFWGGPPPERTLRRAPAHDDTPASKHWQ